MRLSDLRDAKLKSLDGDTLGRVHEVHADGGRIVALTCGPGSWVERLTAKRGGKRIPWECVVKVERKQVIVAPESSASRIRRGIRQPSGRRSKR